MSRRVVRIGAAVLLAVAGLLCWGRAMETAAVLRGAAQTFHLRFEGVQELPEGALDQLERDGERYAVYRQGTLEVEAPLFGRRQTLTRMEAAGEPALLFLPRRLWIGAFPVEARGCLIDAESAQVLWGSAEAVGHTVRIKDEEYTVCGVVDAARPLLLTLWDGTGDFDFTAAAYRPDSDSAFPQQAMEVFLQRLAAEGPVARSEVSRAADLVRAAALLPAWVMLMLAASRLLRLVTPKRLWRWLCLLGVALLAGWALGFPMLVTPDLLPTRWSDFSFWRQKAAAEAERFFTGRMAVGSLPRFLLLWEVALPVAGMAALALAAFLLAARVLATGGNAGQQTDDTKH